jgi:iron complex outermembrane receptor protein
MRFVTTPMLKAGLSAALLSSTSAYAQSAPSSAVDPTTTPPVAAPANVQQSESSAPAAAGPAGSGEIVVTGIRQSLASSAAIKRRADVVVDAVAAEDIGRFPDQNVAESLQRITGVQIDRDRGQGTSVSVRGLSPDLTRTEYNGRFIATPTGSRNFSFTSLASDFVSSVQVLKSPTADMVDGGLAATVNVTSLMPLEAKKDQLNLTAQGLYEPNSGKVTPHLTASYNKKFLDDKVGINVGVSYEKRDNVQGKFESYGLEPATETGKGEDYNHDGVLSPTPTYGLDNAISHQIEFTTDKRLTGILTIEAKPTDNLRIYSDSFFSKFNEDVYRNENQTRWTNIAPASPGDPSGVLSSTIDPGGEISALNADGVDNRVDLRRYGTHDQTFSTAVGAEWTNDRLEVKAEGTYSRAREHSYTSTFGIIARGQSGFSYTGDYGAPPTQTYGFDRLDPSLYNFVSYSNIYDTTVDRNYDGRIDASYRLSDEGFFKKLKVGAYAGNQKNSGDEFSSNLTPQQLAAATGLPYNADVEASSGGSVPFASFLTPAHFGSVPDGQSGFLVVNSKAFDSALPIDKVLGIAPLEHQPANKSSVTEQVLAFYSRLDFGTADDRFGGNIGLRWVQTHQTSDGAAPDLNNVTTAGGGIITQIPDATAITVKHNYSDFLPSLNLRFNITPNTILRFAAAEAMTRPTLGDLRPTFSVDANVKVISSGNPLLKPYKATQFDLSLEHYFRKTGLLSAAVFLKNTKNFVAQGQDTETINVHRPDGTVDAVDFTVNLPVNAEKATIKGAEVAAQYPLDFLPGFLGGFGLLANATYIDAPKVPVQVGAAPQQLPGLSKFSYNVGGFYEQGRIGIRLSYNYRTRYLVDDGFFGDLGYTRAYGQLDGSMNFDLTPRITLTADVVNITGANTYQQTDIGLLRNIYNSGRRITAGVRAHF